MKRLFLLCLLTAIVACTFYSCGKKENVYPAQKLPDITQEGRNTLGFMLGDEIWVPFRTEGLSSNFGTISSLQLLCKRDNVIGSSPRDSFSLELSLQNPGEGNFELNKSNTDILLYVLQKDMKTKTYRFHEKGTLKISMWVKVNLIAAATFSFDLKEESTGEVIKVTDGRFDLKLKF